MNVVYIDELFVLNFGINYILLLLTKKIIRADSRRGMLLISALIGAVYTVLMFMPSLSFMYGMLGKLIFSLSLVALTYNIRGLKQYVKIICIFFAVNFAFGGAIYALIDLTGNLAFFNGAMYVNLPLKLLGTSAICAYICILAYSRFVKRRDSVNRHLYTVSVRVDDSTAAIQCLSDTGNSLYEPISSAPVIVVEYDAIKKILPIDICVIVESDDALSNNSALSLFCSSFKKRNVRLIPYNSLGNKHGLLFGFKPDEILIDGESVEGAIIGIYKGKLSEEHGFYGLINSEILEKISTKDTLQTKQKPKGMVKA